MKFVCPYVYCLNERKLNASKIREHIICDGFLRSYTTWTYKLINFLIVAQTENVVVSTMEDRLQEDKLEDFIIYHFKV